MMITNCSRSSNQLIDLWLWSQRAFFLLDIIPPRLPTSACSPPRLHGPDCAAARRQSCVSLIVYICAMTQYCVIGHCERAAGVWLVSYHLSALPPLTAVHLLNATLYSQPVIFILVFCVFLRCYFLVPNFCIFSGLWDHWSLYYKSYGGFTARVQISLII